VHHHPLNVFSPSFTAVPICAAIGSVFLSAGLAVDSARFFFSPAIVSMLFPFSSTFCALSISAITAATISLFSFSLNLQKKNSVSDAPGADLQACKKNVSLLNYLCTRVTFKLQFKFMILSGSIP